MKCDYCKQEFERLNNFIVPYVSDDNNKKISSTELHLCNKCFIYIANIYKTFLTPYHYEALLSLTMMFEDMLFKNEKGPSGPAKEE